MVNKQIGCIDLRLVFVSRLARKRKRIFSTSSSRGPRSGFRFFPVTANMSGGASSEPEKHQPKEGVCRSPRKHGANTHQRRRRSNLKPPTQEGFIPGAASKSRWRPASMPNRRWHERRLATKHKPGNVATSFERMDTRVKLKSRILHVSKKDLFVVFHFHVVLFVKYACNLLVGSVEPTPV